MTSSRYMRRILLLAAVVLALGASQAQARTTISMSQARHIATEFSREYVKAKVVGCKRVAATRIRCTVEIPIFGEVADSEGNYPGVATRLGTSYDYVNAVLRHGKPVRGQVIEGPASIGV